MPFYGLFYRKICFLLSEQSKIVRNNSEKIKFIFAKVVSMRRHDEFPETGHTI